MTEMYFYLKKVGTDEFLIWSSNNQVIHFEISNIEE